MRNNTSLHNYIGNLNKKGLRELARWIKSELRLGYQANIWFSDGEFTIDYGHHDCPQKELAYSCQLEAGDREPTLQQIEEALQEK